MSLNFSIFTGPGLVEMSTPNGLCKLRLHALPLPEPVTKLLEENSTLLATLHQFTAARLADRSQAPEVTSRLVTSTESQQSNTMTKEMETSLKELREKLKDAFENAGEKWDGAVDNIWAFGPRKTGPNVLLNRIESYDRPSVWTCIEELKLGNVRDFDNSIVNGFQMATLSGPLCEEPMRGVCYAVEFWQMPERSTAKSKFNEPESTNCTKASTDSSFPSGAQESSGSTQICDKTSDSSKELESELESKCNIFPNDTESFQVDTSMCDDNTDQPKTPTTPDSPGSPDWMSGRGPAVAYGQLTGQMMTLMLKAARKSFQSQPQRLVVPMYTCVIQATAEVLGELTYHKGQVVLKHFFK